MPPRLRNSHSVPDASPATPPRANAPADSFPAEFSHACALRDVDDLAGAADAFGRLCMRYPERAETFKALGYVLYQRGMHDRAPAPLLFGFLLDANDPTPLYFAALSERHRGEHEIAREIATDALQVAQASHAHARLAEAAQRLVATL
ncbi:hypothetical protein [Pandoraea pulmonicola]|uniref:Type III secretion low calcium response chaperone LcrH/SycD n=1 Tax=Pandoraea pulmonicola TaxID=93221 RepID=A0AAJ4ZGJ3_PANPU|nr:hypothetical protein [Pandoraea pulmonicola]AJC22724.1 hypothetical protein RO07_23735 [Pandoraea pulmonicola]SUA93028.1 type III secretion low calcium response chaperone LcrH/SycD [Pandoraea pulmonicola]